MGLTLYASWPPELGTLFASARCQYPLITKKRASEFRVEGITRIDTHHQIRREVGAPGPRVVEIVLGVERIISNKAAEDSALQREPLAHGRKI